MEMTETVTHDPSSRLEVLRTEHRDLDVAIDAEVGCHARNLVSAVRRPFHLIDGAGSGHHLERGAELVIQG